jgi:hypothetical protein
MTPDEFKGHTPDAEIRGSVQPILDLWGALRDCEGTMPPLGPDHFKAICTALASETEECAKVAATYAGYGARADVCMAIATAIRSRKDKGE